VNAYIEPGSLMTKLVNPIVIRFTLAPILTVTGRRSGHLRSVPIGGAFTYDGSRYLVSGRGRTHWARNLRAAGVGELRTRSGVERFRAHEATGRERDAVVGAYRRAYGRSVAGYFERIPRPEDHPVFRLERVPGAAAA
jgi:deazaflavin-dependent oxidoreductase (nitroreductase family)